MQKRVIIVMLMITMLLAVTMGKARAEMDMYGHTYPEELYGEEEAWEGHKYQEYMKNYPKVGTINSRYFQFTTNGYYSYKSRSFSEFWVPEGESEILIRQELVIGKTWRSFDVDYRCVVSIVYGVVGYDGKVEYRLFQADVYGPVDRRNYTDVVVVRAHRGQPDRIDIYSRGLPYKIIPLTKIGEDPVIEGVIGQGLSAPNVDKISLGGVVGKEMIIYDFGIVLLTTGRSYTGNPAYMLPADIRPQKEGNYPYADELTEEVTPDETGKIYPVSPTRSWDYLQNFGKEFLPKSDEMNAMVKQCWPRGKEHYEVEEEPWYIYREMNYVIRLTEGGLYYVDLIGVWRQGENFGFGEPNQITLKYKDSYLGGLIGGYYQAYVEVAAGQVMEFAAGNGRRYVSQLGGLSRTGNIESGYIPYKVNKTDKIVAYGPFQPTNDGLDPIPPVEGVYPEKPGDYDPDWSPEESGIPDWVVKMFVPRDLNALPIVSSGLEVVQPAIDLVESMGEMAAFKALEGMPEGKIMLWGGDMAITFNKFFGTEVDVPLINKTISLYGVSRLLSGLAIAVWMAKQAVSVALKLFEEGES